MQISNHIKKTEEMRKYENETGKKAIWRGIITKDFKRWQKGEKIYVEDKERINILVSEEKKKKWEKFADENNINALSKLIRDAVDFYIDIKPKIEEINNFSKSIHNLKEKLSSIKGFSQLLIEEHKDELSWSALLKIKEIIDKSINIEKIISDIFNTHKLENLQYDILIIDDDPSTINLISNYFKNKGYSHIDLSLGNSAIELLQKTVPKLILLDILLPDGSGYDICKKIKTNSKLKDVPVFYITAVPEAEVHSKISETKADGYFLKPFNINEFKTLLNYL
ncbi:MAG: response regulator [Promethearchaeota archaeon]